MSAAARAGNRPHQMKFRGPDGVVRWLNKETTVDKAPEPEFSQGDVVKMVSEFAEQNAESLQFSEMDDAARKFSEAIGTVQRVSGSTVTVYFKGLNKRNWRCDSSNLVKLNKFSLNQLIRIRSDPSTLREIEKQFKNQSVKLKGAIGHVTGVNRKDPSGNLLVQFDDSETYDWLLPSAWMEPFQSPNPSIDKERLSLASKLVALFFKAVEEGDLRNAKLIHERHGVDAEARNPEGKTALHLATQKGYIELMDWLLDEAKVDVNQPDSKGYRAIHSAILGRKMEILEILLEKGAEVDIRNNSGQTALHIAVIKKLTACFLKLNEYKADSNVQDVDGNTALHIAILGGNDLVLNELTSIFSFQWELRNKKGLNIIHQAVMKKDFGTLKFILSQDDMCDPLLELLPNSESTVLHHACANKNYTLAKLLVDESKDWIMPDGLPLLGKLLEARNERGDTALLMACVNKDCAIIELLIESGADAKALDQDGNTAILLAASSAVIDAIPDKESAPAIFKFYERALRKHADLVEAMENHPILALIGYLISKGSWLKAANTDGQTGTAVLLSYGPADVITKMLTELVLRSLNEANSGIQCMGRSGCKQPPIAHLKCPHKEAYKACIGCFQLNWEEEKCGCPEEDVASVLYAFLDLRELSRGSDAEEATTGARPTGSKRKMSGKDGLVGQPPLKKK